jgi:hypothetical protein
MSHEHVPTNKSDLRGERGETTQILEKLTENVNRRSIASHLGLADRLHQRPGDHLLRIYADHREPDSR